MPTCITIQIVNKKKTEGGEMENSLLKKKIRDSGYKFSFIAKNCNLTNAGLYKKLNGQSEFKQSEIKSIKDFLKISDKDLNIYFFN